MKSASALTRIEEQEKFDDVVAQDTARDIASAWMRILATEEMLERMGCGIVAWRAVPPAQNAMAAMVAGMIDKKARVNCVGFQSYGWMSGMGDGTEKVMRVYLGKIHPQNVILSTAEDAATMMKKGPMMIVALHAESASDWHDVRALSAAAVKSGAALLMLISAATPAPEGVAIDMYDNWNSAANAVREAAGQVRDQGAIRVIAMDDMDAAELEGAMMKAAAMSPEAWQDMLQKNNDGAETAANAAYQSPVETF